MGVYLTLNLLTLTTAVVTEKESKPLFLLLIYQ